MGKINVLDFEIANLIAAGEVVERPSSVLKELIENSIDSGADKIVAEIKHGGVALIRVTDNGCGMSAEDMPVALKRHATSKIRERDDLDSIMTLGFRGEALAAISSVSKVTIISKTADAQEGTMLTSEGGKVTDISAVGTSEGTTVVVEDLFYNVPARRKFLKKDSTEAMNVAALVEKVALSRPDISIQLLIDGNERFKTSGDGDLLGAIYSVLGKEFSSKLIKAEGEANGIKITGYIGRSDNVRKNRNLQNIFINGRYVKSLTAMAALEKAYTSYIAPEAFPACVLFLTMNPSQVDVNVHPAKLEVKFASEQSVFEAVYYTVKTALEEYTYRPELELFGKIPAKKEPQNPLNAFVAIDEDTRGRQISINHHQPQAPVKERGTADIKIQTAKVPELDMNKEVRVSSGAASAFSPAKAPSASPKMPAETVSPVDSLALLNRYRTAKPDSSLNYYGSGTAGAKFADNNADLSDSKAEPAGVDIEYRFVGEAFDCYVIVEYEGDLLVIDKHAAHERVVFEELKADQKNHGNVATQLLLIPIDVKISAEEAASLDDYRDDFKAVGFTYTVNEDKAIITEIPDAISSQDAEGLFIKMAGELVEGRGKPEITDSIRRERALYQVACKAAIKGGRIYDRAILDWLVRKLLSLPNVIVCPHGRPVAYKIKKSEMDRNFGRLK